MKNIQIVPRWFWPALLLLFVALKLTGHIDWSWWWVLSPFWVPFAFVGVVMVAVALWHLPRLIIDLWRIWVPRRG